jgi:DNA-binding NarL/FixJ family response regulator
MNRTRILLADDHMMFTECLDGLLRDDFELLGKVENGADLIESAGRLQPDIIILDISMPVMNGFDAARELRKRRTSAKIIFLTMHSDAGLVAEAVRCGASGFVVKQSAGKDLISAIRDVAEGKTYFPSLDTSQLKPHSLNLTPRQRDVLRLIAQGLTMKQAATELGISTRTAESHKYEMMEALGVETTADLIKYAIKLGLISI